MNTFVAKAARVSAIIVVSALALTGCSGQGNGKGAEGGSTPSAAKLGVSDMYMAETGSGTASVFALIQNSGNAADHLDSVSSDIAEGVQFHDSADDKAAPVSGFDIPAHGKLELKDGGPHILFTGLKGKQPVGSAITVTLRFKHTPAMKLAVPVRGKVEVPSGR
ncbi:copper chaperone PCu(A)C [Streptomyces sp. NPDC002537]